MAEVILQKAGFNKEKTAEKYSGITGTNMEEARKAIESVVQGNKIILTVPDAQNVPFVIQQFSEVGAVAIENTESMNENVENNAVQERETIDKNEQYEIAKQETGEGVVEGEVVETLELGVTMVDLDDISNAGRNTILPVLDDVCKVSEHINNLADKMKQLADEAKKIKDNVNNVYLDTPISLLSLETAVEWILGIGVFVWLMITAMNNNGSISAATVITALIISIIVAFIGGAIFSVILDVTVRADELQERTKKLQIKREAYLQENLVPKEEEEKKFKKIVEEYLSSAEVYWAVNVVGEGYFNTEIIKKLASLITSRRADSLKEALNLYETIKYQENMQNMQSSILELANAGVEAAKEQAEYAKQIEQNTAAAARAAEVNAVAAMANAKANAAAAATAKKIYKEIKR